ncbi:glycosyltransferase family 2 protein [Agathobacter sp.]
MNYLIADTNIESELIYGCPNYKEVELSIVIPTYKRSEYLKKTIRSIKRQKGLDKINCEVLIVSNDPEFNIDDLKGLLCEHLFKVYRNKENLGMVGNMNRCAILAHGKYISYIQDDDILLENYVENIVNLIEHGMIENIDCLIPNRYYYYDIANKNSVFGEKSYKQEKKKEILKKLLSVGTVIKDFQKVTTKDCANTWFNCYGGGPTCGMLFKRESLLKTEGFSREYPYAFDFVFFMDFSDNYNVVLYNKYLSIYRMTDSASNRPDVQKDFYRSDMCLFEKTCNINWFVTFFKDEIIRFSFENKSLEAQEMIDQVPYVKNNIKYALFRMVRFVKLMRSNTYRRKLLPEELLYKV